MEYERNHYVPVWLSSHWQGGADNRLTLFQRHQGVLHQDRKPASAVCYSRGIYVTHDLADSARDVSVERDFFTSEVDTPGAQVHRLMLGDGLSSLDAAQRGYWAQFLVAQYMRVPRTLQKLDAIALLALDEQLKDLPSELKVGDITLHEIRPLADRKLARGGLPAFIQQDRLFDEMRQGYWDVRKIAANCPTTLLIGDHPLISRGSRQSGYEVMLPLAPRAVFIKSPTKARRRELLGGTDEGFVKRTNLETVTFASRYVMSDDESQFRFVDRHLRATPDTV